MTVNLAALLHKCGKIKKIILFWKSTDKQVLAKCNKYKANLDSILSSYKILSAVFYNVFVFSHIFSRFIRYSYKKASQISSFNKI